MVVGLTVGVVCVEGTFLLSTSLCLAEDLSLARRDRVSAIQAQADYCCHWLCVDHDTPRDGIQYLWRIGSWVCLDYLSPCVMNSNSDSHN